MKRVLAFATVIILTFAAFPLAACIGNAGKPEQQTQGHSFESSAPLTDTPQPTEDAAPVQTAEPTVAPSVFLPSERPEEVTVEWLAAELMYRYYLGCIIGELADYSDIMDRNEDTDMFYYTNQLEIDVSELYDMKNILGAAPGTAQIEWVVEESETEITAHVSVSTHIDWDDPNTSDPGTDFQITVDKQRMVITAFDQFLCEGIYNNRMQPTALRYRRDHPWEEADKLAYDEIYAQFKKEAGY